MLVTFTSSESGAMLMYARDARPFLKAMGKNCSARGVITQAEMPAAIMHIERYLRTLPAPRPEPVTDDMDAEAGKPPVPRVSAAQRAWPLLDMLARTAKSKKESHILWEASADFAEEDDARDAA
ncbi:MAG: DUF1840 domain-containing protein [Zoogloeaceae bacterium]|jgi:hypothetical protein|nr:DUF1840 domain-containing protein [Zoogloeaceae bacterium]